MVVITLRQSKMAIGTPWNSMSRRSSSTPRLMTPEGIELPINNRHIMTYLPETIRHHIHNVNVVW